MPRSSPRRRPAQPGDHDEGMTSRLPARLDAYAAAAALLTVAGLAVYLVVAGGRRSGPAAWVVVLLLVLAAIAGYAATLRRGHRALLVLDGVLLGALGLLSMLSIGAPLIIAAALCFTSVLKARRADAAAARAAAGAGARGERPAP